MRMMKWIAMPGLVCLALCACDGGTEYTSATVTDSPLYVAIREGDLTEVQRMMQEDFDALHRGEGTFAETPLHQAAAADQVEIAAFLIECGAAVNAFDGRRQTPLTAAVDAEASDAMIDLIRYYGGDD